MKLFSLPYKKEKVTMKHPLNSLLFLTMARKSICEIFDGESDDTNEVKKFITNEASDYQIISILTTGDIPLEESTFEDEIIMWESFKRWVVTRSATLTEIFDYISPEIMESVIEDITFEMGPVSDLFLSSAAPILEFHTESGYLQEVLAEGKKLDVVKDLFNPKLTADYLKKKKDALVAANKKRLEKREEKKKKGQVAFVAAGKKASVEAIAKKEAAAKSIAKQQKGTQNIVKIRLAAEKKKKDDAATATAAAKRASNIKASKNVAIAAGVGAVGAYAAKKAYDRYFSKAAKACKGLSGSDRSACIKKAKTSAKKAAK
jgi:hypothetical protein